MLLPEWQLPAAVQCLIVDEWRRMGAGLSCPEVSPRETFATCIQSAYLAGLERAEAVIRSSGVRGAHKLAAVVHAEQEARNNYGGTGRVASEPPAGGSR